MNNNKLYRYLFLAYQNYSRICLSRHFKGNRKNGDLGKQQFKYA